MTELPNRKADKAMGKMEDAISGLQDDVAISQEPPANHFKPLWLLAAVLVAVMIGGGTFLMVTRLTHVDRNSQSISKGCEERNRALEAVNEKFAQLTLLFDASTVNRDPNLPPIPPEVLHLYDEFKKPIPLPPCL